MGPVHQIMDSNQDSGPQLCLSVAIAGKRKMHRSLPFHLLYIIYIYS